MSGGFGNKDNVFGQSSASFGQVFGSGSVFKDSSEGAVFGASPAFSAPPNTQSTATGENLFAQFASPTTSANVFGGRSVFGEAKLFCSKSSTKETKSVFPSPVFSKESSTRASDSLVASKSLPNIPGKDTRSSTSGSNQLFGKPVLTTTTVTSQSETVLFGKPLINQPNKLFQSKGKGDDHPKQSAPSKTGLFGKPTVLSEREITDESQESTDAKRSLFGRSPEKGKTTRRSFIRRADDQASTAGRSIFAKAVTVATGKSLGRHVDETEGREKKQIRSRKSSDEGETRPLRRLSRTLSNSDEILTKVAVVCKDVPSSVNNVIQLKKHFSRYGLVTKVFPSPAKRSATIHFKTHEEAANAKKKGRVPLPGQPPLQIFWSSHTPSSASSTLSSKTMATRKSSASRPVRSVAGRSEVDDELASMAGSDIAGPSYRTLERPGDVPSDLSPSKRQRAVTRRLGNQSPPRTVSPTPSASDTTQKPAITKGVARKSSKPVPVRSASSWSEVDDELASMAGSDIAGLSYRTLEHPGDVLSDLSPSKRPRGVTRLPRSRSPPPPRTVSPTPSASDTTQKPAITKATFESLRIPAKHTLDMYAIMESRDKILKHGRKKQSDLKTAKAVQGTCPDMCYEKERYDRDAKRRLSTYEIIPGTENIPGQNPQVAHQRAVKEYSRSSADQEEPLPHEMRPGPVLDMTMTYLLTEIADTGSDNNWLDWFDFLWNRTRGIRKDITQQMLCDKTVVGLIEKCARFHIYCAERLSEVDSHTFDQKINTENLTKSLQSLKELYSDLATKFSIFCDTEAEFRAYFVLLNLNEGDTLREVQQLRPAVRDSPELNFALKVYSALNSNNYVRFFKLVKQATFLNACILHRYFIQVRSRALKTMLRAYAIGGRPIQYPLAELMRVIAFEDTNETAEFCGHYGLFVAAEEVLLDKKSYIEPELSLSLRRAHSLIESKQQVSVGQVINGGPLPPLELPAPQISFDANGRYIGEMPTVEAFSREPEVRISKSERDIPVQKPVEKEVPEPAKGPKIPHTVVKEIARELFLEVIDEFSADISKQLYTAIKDFLQTTTNQMWEGIYQEVSQPMIKSMSTEVVESELQMKAKQEEIAARMVQRERAARAEMEDMLEEVLCGQINEVAGEEIKEIEKQLHDEREARISENLKEELLEEVVMEMVQSTAQIVHHSDVVHPLLLRQEAERCIEIYKMGNMWRAWRKAYANRARLKRAMLTFPSAPSTESPLDQVNSLIPDRQCDKIHNGAMYINKSAKLIVDRPLTYVEQQQQFDDRITLHNLVSNLRQLISWSPLNIGSVMGRELLQTLQKTSQQKVLNGEEVFWKLLVSLPDSEETDIHTQTLCDWLQTKFTKGVLPDLEEECPKVNTVALYSSPLKYPQQPVIKLSMCVKVIDGTLQDEEVALLEATNSLLGSSALLFALPPTEQFTNEYWLEAQLRLVRILQAKPIYPSLPLVIIFPEMTSSFPSTGKVYDMLNLLALIQGQLVSSVHIMSLKFSPLSGVDVISNDVTFKLEESLRWLGERFVPPPDLQSNTLLSLVEETLSSEFYAPVLYNLKQRKRLGYLHQAPEVLINLYNSVIHHVKGVVTSPSLRVHSWPVTEFSLSRKNLPRPYWNSEDHMTHLSETLHSVVLPELDYQMVESESWQQACQDVWRFANDVAEGMTEGQQKTQFLSRIRNVLRTNEEEFEDTCFLVEGDRACQPTYVNMPWTDIIMAAVNYKLLSTDFYDPNQDDELIVVHFDKSSTEFVAPLDWKMAQSDRQTVGGVSVKSTVCHAAERKRHLTSHEDSLTMKRSCVNLTEDSVIFDMEPLSEEVVMATDISHSLKDTLAIEKKESEMFEEFLQKALNSDTEVFKSESWVELPPLVPQNISNASSFHLNCSAILPEPLIPLNDAMNTLGQQVAVEMCSDVKQNCSSTLQEGLISLKQDIATTRHANELFEMRLRNMLEN